MCGFQAVSLDRDTVLAQKDMETMYSHMWTHRKPYLNNLMFLKKTNIISVHSLRMFRQKHWFRLFVKKRAKFGVSNGCRDVIFVIVE